jgi:hypothetical protein
MHLRISDTFTDSLARLTADEQKLGKTAAFNRQQRRGAEPIQNLIPPPSRNSPCYPV